MVIDLVAGEKLRNNDIYVVDPSTRMIRKAKAPDEWFAYQTVYVCNMDVYDFARDLYGDNMIESGDHCRCEIAHLLR